MLKMSFGSKGALSHPKPRYKRDLRKYSYIVVKIYTRIKNHLYNILVK